jgi:hypothetical protein
MANGPHCVHLPPPDGIFFEDRSMQRLFDAAVIAESVETFECAVASDDELMETLAAQPEDLRCAWVFYYFVEDMLASYVRRYGNRPVIH